LGIYAADGSYNVTVVDGLSWVGLYAADGSLNVYEVDGTEPVGAYHSSGALNVYVTSSAVLKYRHPSGALYVSETPYLTGSTKVTVVAGAFAGGAYNPSLDFSIANNSQYFLTPWRT